MRKTLLIFLAILFMAPMLSGCFCPYWIDGDGRGYGHDRGYGGQREGSRDYRERR